MKIEATNLLENADLGRKVDHYKIWKTFDHL